MSKELTPLEALKDLREDAKHHLDHHIVYLNERLDIIEKALKEYEGAKKHIEALNKERIENSIKLKALEIIKEKRVEFSLLYKSKTVEEYNNWLWAIIDHKVYPLTQTEFELLREVLL